MTKADDSAFTGPTPEGHVRGLTKREYMATAIASGLVSNGVPPNWQDQEMFSSWSEWVSQMSVEMTDDIIKHLNKEK